MRNTTTVTIDAKTAREAYYALRILNLRYLKEGTAFDVDVNNACVALAMAINADVWAQEVVA